MTTKKVMTKSNTIDIFGIMESTPYNYNEAVAALQAMINGWLAEDSKRSRSSLARRADVNEATIRRIVNNGTLPQPHNIYKIVSFLKGVSTNKEVVEQSGSALSSLIAFHLPYAVFEESSGNVRIPAAIEGQLNSSIKRVLFTKVCASSGLSEELIRYDFGQLGIAEANDLVNLGILIVENSLFRVVEQFRNYSLSPSLSKETIIDISKLYFKAELETNYSYNITESVSLSGYNEVMDIMQEAHAKITKVVKRNPGMYPLFAVAMMDTLTIESAFTSNKEESV